jgi:predicted nucleic acid-binding protein
VTLVVDASIALKWFLPYEPLADRAVSIVRDGTPLIAPDILVAEVCNAAWRLARLGRFKQDQVAEIAAILPRFFDALVGAADLAPRAVAIARELDHPVYDCLYVTLAEERRARLVTADTRLLEKLQQTRWEPNAQDLGDYQSEP